jgi:hypothetical protein
MKRHRASPHRIIIQPPSCRLGLAEKTSVLYVGMLGEQFSCGLGGVSAGVTPDTSLLRMEARLTAQFLAQLGNPNGLEFGPSMTADELTAQLQAIMEAANGAT